MGRTAKPIELTPEQDAHLRTLEHDPTLPQQTRTRAQIVRLAAQGIPRSQIAAYVRYHPKTIERILRRFRRSGTESLHERPRPGRTPKWTPQATALVHACLCHARTWTCTQLQRQLAKTLGLQLGRETIRLHLQQLGYSWQRTRYVPLRHPDPTDEAVFGTVIERLQRGHAWGR
jgi:transposase